MHFRRSLRGPAAALGLASLIACGGGDKGPTGPSTTFSPVGAWALSITDAKTGTTTCAVTGNVVTFVNTSGTLTGSLTAGAGATNSCVINGQTQTSPLTGTGSLSSVTQTGNTISFTYNTTSGPNTMTGTIQSDTRMGGSASIRLSFSGVPTTLVGSWSATRL